jgi:toxin HigB-1
MVVTRAEQKVAAVSNAWARVRVRMNAPGYALHPLKGDLEGHWAVRVSGNWRLTFAFEGEDAILVDYQDYH